MEAAGIYLNIYLYVRCANGLKKNDTHKSHGMPAGKGVGATAPFAFTGKFIILLLSFCFVLFFMHLPSAPKCSRPSKMPRKNFNSIVPDIV